MSKPLPPSTASSPFTLEHHPLGRRWSRYSAAALGGLAGTFSGFEATQAALVIIPTSHTLTDNPGSPPSVTLDLNGDGTPEIGLLVFSASLASAQGLNGASLAGTVGTGGFFYPTGLQPGQSVAPTLVFSGNSAGLPNSFGTLANSAAGVGDWAGGLDGYLGVQFDIGGNTHYGWVHVVWDPGLAQLRIDQMAYNDQALAAALVVPEPSGLVLLGLGAMGLMQRRRRKPLTSC